MNVRPSNDTFVDSSRAHIVFISLLLASTLLSIQSWRALFTLALQNDSYSQTVIIPFVSLFFLYAERDRFLRAIRPSSSIGAMIFALAGVIYFLAARERLGIKMFAVALMWTGAFITAYGLDALRKSPFPFLLLILMIPPPGKAIEWAVHQLQQGSTDISYALFNLFGVPVFRRGFVLALPSVTIEVAEECSGIRSSIAMLITCLLAAHLYLRTFWKYALFILLVVPLMVIKNGIRIVTLTMLAINVDPSFLTGRLHHEGGIVFFILALVLMVPILIILERSERLQVSTYPGSATPLSRRL